MEIKNFGIFFAIICVGVSANPIFKSIYSSPRLQNAQWANQNQFPYQVSITSISSSTGTFTLCSGALIASTWILTSATCVIQSQAFHIRFASVTHYTGGVVYESSSAQIHPQYNPEDGSNNVALIALPTRPISQGVAVINLPTPAVETSSSARLVTVSGWGLTRSNDSSPVLQFAYGQVLSNKDPQCVESRNVTEIPAEQLCVNVLRQQAGVCSGDTGSPVVVLHNKVLFVVGIASNNPNDKDCNHSTTLFTRVLRVVSWIAEVTRPSHTH